MKHDIPPRENDDGRSRQQNQERAHEAAPSTPPAPEVAAPPVAMDGLSLVREIPNTGQPPACLALEPASVQVLLLTILATAADVIQERSPGAFRAKIEAIGEGRLPSVIADSVGVLVRGALIGCSVVASTRRTYATRMLPTAVDAAAVAANAGIVGCAPVEGGYDVAIRHADGFTVVVTVALPQHLLGDIIDAVILLAARVLGAASDAQAHQRLRRLAAGHLDREFADAVALAVVAAANDSAMVSAANKELIVGNSVVEALLHRAA